jgi:hypothetical protein
MGPLRGAHAHRPPSGSEAAAVEDVRDWAARQAGFAFETDRGALFSAKQL